MNNNNFKTDLLEESNWKIENDKLIRLGSDNNELYFYTIITGDSWTSRIRNIGFKLVVDKNIINLSLIDRVRLHFGVNRLIKHISNKPLVITISPDELEKEVMTNRVKVTNKVKSHIPLHERDSHSGYFKSLQKELEKRDAVSKVVKNINYNLTDEELLRRINRVSNEVTNNSRRTKIKTISKEELIKKNNGKK